MVTPEDYEDIRDNENKSWSCGISRKGYEDPVNIRGTRMSIKYECFPTDDPYGGLNTTEVITVDLTDQPRLLSSIESALTKAIRGI